MLSILDRDKDAAARKAAGATVGGAVSRRLGAASVWFRSFRRTRPFWGGLWMIVGGWLILRMSMISLQVMFSAGLTGFGGWLSGGGLIICGLIVWCAPTQRYVAGLIGLLLAVVSLVISNLGGLFIGMLVGIVGSAMALAWGPKRPRRKRTNIVEHETVADETPVQPPHDTAKVDAVSVPRPRATLPKAPAMKRPTLHRSTLTPRVGWKTNRPMAQRIRASLPHGQR